MGTRWGGWGGGGTGCAGGLCQRRRAGQGAVCSSPCGISWVVAWGVAGEEGHFGKYGVLWADFGKEMAVEVRELVEGKIEERYVERGLQNGSNR
jgi:hypothetical protein